MPLTPVGGVAMPFVPRAYSLLMKFMSSTHNPTDLIAIEALNEHKKWELQQLAANKTHLICCNIVALYWKYLFGNLGMCKAKKCEVKIGFLFPYSQVIGVLASLFSETGTAY